MSYAAKYNTLNTQDYSLLLDRKFLKTFIIYMTDLRNTTNLQFLSPEESNLLNLVNKIIRLSTTSAKLKQSGFEQLWKGEIPVGGATEHFEFNYVAPSALEIDFTNAEEVEKNLHQKFALPTHLPNSYSYPGKVWQCYISITEDEYKTAARSLQDWAMMTGKKIERFGETIGATKRSIGKAAITSAIHENLLKFCKAEKFDPAKDYNLTHQIEMLKQGVSSNKYTYQTFYDTETINENTKFGVCFQPIKANEFDSFDAAVAGGKIIVYEILQQFHKPGIGQTPEEQKISSQYFIEEIGKATLEAEDDTQGFSLSGNLIGGEGKTLDAYFTKESLTPLRTLYADTYHIDQIKTGITNGSTFKVNDFGHSDLLMSKLPTSDIYNNGSPMNKALVNGHSNNFLKRDYNVFGYIVDRDKINIFTLKEIYDFDHSGALGVDTIYYRGQNLTEIHPNYFEILLVQNKKKLFQDLGLMEAEA